MADNAETEEKDLGDHADYQLPDPLDEIANDSKFEMEIHFHDECTRTTNRLRQRSYRSALIVVSSTSEKV